MPSLDGIGLALKVAKDFPALPVLLMTGYSAERQRAHNLEELICEVITKPFTLQEICEAAEAALDAEQMTCHRGGEPGIARASQPLHCTPWATPQGRIGR